MTLQEAIDKFDTVFGSCSRPAIAIMCGAAVAASCLIPASASIAIPSATAIVMTYIGTRGVENVKKMSAASADKAADVAGSMAGKDGVTGTAAVTAP